MNRNAPSARLLAIPLVTVSLLLGTSTAGAYQDPTPVVPVETPVPPVVAETPEPAPETTVPPDSELTPMPGGMAGPGPQQGAGGEPPTDEGATVNAAAAPEPPTDGGEAVKRAPRGRVSVRNVRRNVDTRTVDESGGAANPAPVAGDQGAPALPAVLVIANSEVSDTSVAEAVSGARTRPRALPAESAPRSAVTALPATGVGAPIERGVVPLALAASALTLLLGAGRLRRRVV